MKKQRRNGFTLIELLAVIIILAVIALIATPIILNVVENAQKKAFERSAQGYYDAARYVHNDMMLKEEEQDIMFIFENGQQRSDNEKYTLTVQGEVPKKGLVYLTKDGEILLSIANDKWCATTNGDGTIELTDDPSACGYAPLECYTFSDFTLIDGMKKMLTDNNADFEGMDGTLLQVDGFDKENPLCKGIVIIPEEYNGRKIEGIKAAAFRSNDNITSVILPKEMKVIDKIAFGVDSNLKQVVMNDELRYIAQGAFMNTQINEIKLPDKIVYLGRYAFRNANVKTITFSNSSLTIESEAFINNQITSLDIPDTIISIGSNAFIDNQINYLSIGKIVQNLDGTEFANNPLTTLTIKEGTLGIKAKTFAKHAIINLHLPNTLKVIQSTAFAGNQITNLTIPSNVVMIQDKAFSANKFPNAEAITILGDDPNRFDSIWESIGFPAKN